MPEKEKKPNNVADSCHNCQILRPNPDGQGHCRNCGAVVNPAKAAT